MSCQTSLIFASTCASNDTNFRIIMATNSVLNSVFASCTTLSMCSFKSERMDVTSFCILSICCDVAYAESCNWVVDSPIDRTLCRNSLISLFTNVDNSAINLLYSDSYISWLLANQRSTPNQSAAFCNWYHNSSSLSFVR